MTAAEAYSEAQRRIQAARLSGQHWLDLGDISGLEQIPDEIAELTALRELGLGTRVYDQDKNTWGWEIDRWLAARPLADLSPLAGLIALQTLDVRGSPVSDLTPLVGLSALQSLNVMNTKVSDLTPLVGLIALQSLGVGSTKVSDLTPLAGLIALQSLDLGDTQVSDLTPLVGLSALQSLDVSECQCITSWEPLRGHSSLQRLDVYGSGPSLLTPEWCESFPVLEELFADRILGVPPEVLSEYFYSDCLKGFRSWAADLRAGEDKDQEVKVFVLGNGTAGKTQICRQLRGEDYDDQVPSTHGVQIGHFPLLPDAGQGATKAKLWDFGGQDIYHGTHALFLEGRAVFILVWSREVEAAGDYEESGLSMHHHRLTYWLDYVRSLAGEDAALIVVQAKCDKESDRANAPLPAEHGFRRPLPQVTCSAKLGEMDELNAAIRSATRYLLETQAPTACLQAGWRCGTSCGSSKARRKPSAVRALTSCAARPMAPACPPRC